MSDPGWLWLSLADFYWPWWTLAYSSWLLPTLTDSGRLWPTLADSGWTWLTLADSGWLWLTLADYGGQPESARVIQSHQKSSKVGQSQPESARICQSQQEFLLGFGLLLTFWAPRGPLKNFFCVENLCKIIFWPQNCKIKPMFITVVVFHTKWQKWLKLWQNMTSFRHNMHLGCCNPKCIF